MGRGKGIQFTRKKAGKKHTNEECSSMINKWLKKNKPSVTIDNNIKMPHLTPSGKIGKGELY